MPTPVKRSHPQLLPVIRTDHDDNKYLEWDVTCEDCNFQRTFSEDRAASDAYFEHECEGREIIIL